MLPADNFTVTALGSTFTARAMMVSKVYFSSTRPSSAMFSKFTFSITKFTNTGKYGDVVVVVVVVEFTPGAGVKFVSFMVSCQRSSPEYEACVVVVAFGSSVVVEVVVEVVVVVLVVALPLVSVLLLPLGGAGAG